MAEEKQIPIMLALQGGGSHGAITWGVLDRLLEEDSIKIEGVSGASAGAMNAVVMASGLANGGREAAKENLASFWEAASEAGGGKIPSLPGMLGKLVDMFGEAPRDAMGRYIAQFQKNPLGLNPLKGILEDHVDFESLRDTSEGSPKLFVSAMNPNKAETRTFTNEDISANAVMASATLPQLFPAQKIDGEEYWDGGYRSNPPVRPLVEGCESSDLVVVHLNPFQRKHTPIMTMDIIGRENELQFNASLQKDYGHIMADKQAYHDGDRSAPPSPTAQVRLHSVNDDDMLDNLRPANKSKVDWKYIQKLRDMGRAQAEQWIEEVLPKLGKESSFDPSGIIGDEVKLTPHLLSKMDRELPTFAQTARSGTALSSGTIAAAPQPEARVLLHANDPKHIDHETKTVGQTVVALECETHDGQSQYRIPSIPVDADAQEQPTDAAERLMATLNISAKRVKGTEAMSSGIAYNNGHAAGSYHTQHADVSVAALKKLADGYTTPENPDVTLEIMSLSEAKALPKSSFPQFRAHEAIEELSEELGTKKRQRQMV